MNQNNQADFPLTPSAEQIAALAKERADLARLHDDTPGARQLDRVRMNVLNGARLCWHLGDLLIQSVNNPGNVYSVNRSGCTCPNGASGKAACWHVALFDLLLDMLDEEAATADMEAEAAEDAPQAMSAHEWDAARRSLIERLTLARVAAEILNAA